MRPSPLPPTSVHDLTLAHVGGQPSLRVAIARTLDAAGAHEITAGRPAEGPAEAAATAAVAKAIGRERAVAACRMSESEVDAVAAAGLIAVHLAVPLSESAIRAAYGSDRLSVLSRIRQVVRHARGRGLAVTVGGEDASRAEIDYVCAAMIVAEESGARRFRFSDSAGTLDPFAAHAIFRHLCAETDIELEFLGSDAHGMAAANTVAAVRGGATHACTAVLGLGDGGGTAPFDEVVGTLMPLTGPAQTIRSARMAALADRITATTALPTQGRRSGELSADWAMRSADLDVLVEAGRLGWARPSVPFAVNG